MRRKSLLKVTLAMLAIAPAISAPVGPAPTSTMVSSSLCLEGSACVSAIS